MPSYKDFLSLSGKELNNESLLRRAITTMSSVANKRLRRLENAGIIYSKHNVYEGEQSIAGVRRFGTYGAKNIEQLKQEYYRVMNYLKAKQSSLTGRMQAQKSLEKNIYKRLNKKQKADFEKMVKQQETSEINYGKGFTQKRMSKYTKLKVWEKLWDIYNELEENGHYAQAFVQDSHDTVRTLYTMIVSSSKSLSIDSLIDKAKKILDDKYVAKIKEDGTIEDDIEYKSTSDFMK